MTTEVWFRNPHNYIRELAEVGVGRIAWDRGLCVKRNIDPLKHAEAYFLGREWRVLLIGEQGSAEYTNTSGSTPVGVYPTWDAGLDDVAILEEMMAYPLGEDADACNDPTVRDDERPVAGQIHRVVIINIPEQRTVQGKAFIRKLKELQEDYPECQVYLHGLYSWRVNFGMGFGAADVDPRTNAGKGKVTLPTGREMIAEKTVGCPQWVNLLGMKPIDLTKEPRNRCIYNIKSAVWAADNFMENVAFASRATASTPAPDITSIKAAPIETVKKSHTSLPMVAQPSDKISCDVCSLINTCKFYRQGSVCSVPGSEPANLAKQFKTRDADSIIDGLSSLLSSQAARLERGVADENMYGELDPEVTKLSNLVFNNGLKLVKVLDPARFSGPKVQVNVNGGGATAVQAATPNQVLGAIVRELESRGVPRDKITPTMVENLLAEMGGAGRAPQAIEGVVLGSTEE